MRTRDGLIERNRVTSLNKNVKELDQLEDMLNVHETSLMSNQQTVSGIFQLLIVMDIFRSLG